MFNILCQILIAQIVRNTVSQFVILGEIMGRNNTWESLKARPKYFGKLVGTSKASRLMYEKILQHIDTQEPITIIGQTGSGRTKAAQMLHDYSDRKSEPFFLIDSAASKGIFLKNIESYPHSTALIKKAKAEDLDVVQKASIKMRKINFILSMNKNMPNLDKNRLIEIPSLKERQSDIVDLSYVFLKYFKKKHNAIIQDFSSDVLHVFKTYQWPGNIAELKDVIESLVIHTSNPIASILSLPEELQRYCFKTPRADSWQPLSLPLWQIEKRAIQQAIQFCDGNVVEAAKILDVSPSTLYRKMQSWQK